MNILLVTGVAGFIGYHVAERLLQAGQRVLGLDNLNPYYDVTLKHARLDRLKRYSHFEFSLTDLANRQAMDDLFSKYSIRRVIHLAAQAGVRYSLDNPHLYVDSNIVGTLNVLEGCKRRQVEHLVYASSSSVYGSNTSQPLSVSDPTDHPLSLYAVTKKANELMAHSYAHLCGLPTTGLRFFTAYGPWGRPDMALFKFTKAMLDGQPIDLYNGGDMKRDFTYIDDIVTGVVRVLDMPPSSSPNWNSLQPDPSTSSAPFRLHNIGNHNPIDLRHLVAVLEQALGKKAICRALPMQPGDVPATFADVDSLSEAVGFSPATSIEEGIARFVKWYREYYGRHD